MKFLNIFCFAQLSTIRLQFVRNDTTAGSFAGGMGLPGSSAEVLLRQETLSRLQEVEFGRAMLSGLPGIVPGLPILHVSNKTCLLQKRVFIWALKQVRQFQGFDGSVVGDYLDMDVVECWREGRGGGAIHHSMVHHSGRQLLDFNCATELVNCQLLKSGVVKTTFCPRLLWLKGFKLGLRQPERVNLEVTALHNPTDSNQW